MVSQNTPVIPKIIHQFWDRPEPPADVAERLASWRQHHPGWEHIVWNDESAELFIRSHFGRDEAICFRACRIPAMRCDVFRLAVLLAIGGVYADADMLCLKSVEPLTGAVCTVVYDKRRDKPDMVSNAFLLAEPGHPLLRASWDRVIKTLKAGPKTIGNIAILSGPRMFTAVWERLPKEQREGIQLLSLKQEFQFVELSRSLSYHLAEGTWKEQAKMLGRILDHDILRELSSTS